MHCDLIAESQETSDKSGLQDEILERLDKLEILLAANNRNIQNSQPAIPLLSRGPPIADIFKSSDVTSELQNLDRDVALLESIYLEDRNSVSIVPFNSSLRLKLISGKEQRNSRQSDDLSDVLIEGRRTGKTLLLPA